MRGVERFLRSDAAGGVAGRRRQNEEQGAWSGRRITNGTINKKVSPKLRVWGTARRSPASALTKFYLTTFGGIKTPFPSSLPPHAVYSFGSTHFLCFSKFRGNL